MNRCQISIIVPTCGRLDTLERCLNAVIQSAKPFEPGAVEIIVSDDASSSATAEKIRKQFPAVRYIAGPGRGPASNRNKGASHANGDYLAFTDDDCIPDSAWLSAYHKAIKNSPNIKVLEGRVFADRPQESFDETSPLNENGGFLWSCNFAIERELFSRLGGFDERFPFAAMEDVELRKRIRDTNTPMVFVPEAAVCHPWRKKQGWSEFKKRQYSTFLYLALHPAEKAEINPLNYIYSVAYGMTKFVLPRVFKGMTRGLAVQMLEYYSFLEMAFKLTFTRPDLSAYKIPIKSQDDSSYRS